jgi:hypothetical protein
MAKRREPMLRGAGSAADAIALVAVRSFKSTKGRNFSGCSDYVNFPESTADISTTVADERRTLNSFDGLVILTLVLTPFTLGSLQITC